MSIIKTEMKSTAVSETRLDTAVYLYVISCYCGLNLFPTHLDVWDCIICYIHNVMRPCQQDGVCILTLIIYSSTLYSLNKANTSFLQ